MAPPLGRLALTLRGNAACSEDEGRLRCEGCGEMSDSLASGWAAFLAEDVDGLEPTAVACYCPSCAGDEFGFVPRFYTPPRRRDEKSSD